MQKQQERPMKELSKRKVLGPCATVFTSANTGSWRQERPLVNTEKCVRCGICAMYCPVDCITVDKAGVIPVTIDWHYCKGCGICGNECPRKAIEFVSEKEVCKRAD